jgi:hypothetical protein
VEQGQSADPTNRTPTSSNAWATSTRSCRSGDTYAPRTPSSPSGTAGPPRSWPTTCPVT